MRKLILFLAVTIISGTSCQEINDIEADKQALIELTTEDFDANFLSGNPDASVDFYTETALRIQNGKKYSGKEAIRGTLTKVRAGFTVSEYKNMVEDTWISGDLATVRGTFTGSWVHHEWGDTLWSKNAWVHVCERQEDGTWKMVFTLVSDF